MIAMADRHGRVYASVPGLAHRARVTVDECKEALRTFEEPDEDSRTKEFEGRRILAFEGGWELLNHAKYRAIQNDEAIRESKRAYMQRQREKWNSGSTVENLPLDLDLPKEEKVPTKKHLRRDDWRPARTAKTLELEAKVNVAKEWDRFCDHHDKHASKFASWDAAWRTWLHNAPIFAAKNGPRQPEKSERQRKQDEGEYAR
jgi:hypothetical protein